MQDKPSQKPNLEISHKEYQKLKAEIERELKRTEATGTKARNEICNQSHWNVGLKLNRLKDKATKTIGELARDTGRQPMFYYRAALFQRAWPRGLSDDAKRIAWSNHLELLSTADMERRVYYVKRCLSDMSRNDLRKAIRRDEYALAKTGKLALSRLEPLALPYFTYRAKVTSYPDGDTLNVELDLGFNTKRTETVRLRGINCAEIKSLPKTAARAQKARAFVMERLSGVPFVTITTHKSDRYGRYLADVLYVPKDSPTGEAVYLNQELLDAGLAERMG